MKRKITLKRLLRNRTRNKILKSFVENRSDRSKKSIIVFCVITIVVMMIMNLCTAVRPLFEKAQEIHQRVLFSEPEKEITIAVEQ